MNVPPVVFWSYFLTLIGLTGIILIVAAKNLRSKVNRAFLLFTMLMWLFIGASFLSEFPADLNKAIFWSRTALFLACFIPISFFYFVTAFTGYKPKRKWILPTFYGLLIASAFSAYLPGNIISVKRGEFGTTLDKLGPLLWLTMIYFIVVFFVCFKVLYGHSRTSEQRVKLQIRLMLYGVGVVVGINLITQIALPEFHVAELGNVIGNPSDLLLVGCLAYAIFKHSLFDIKAVVLSTIGYLVTVVAIIVLYALGFLALSRILFPQLKFTATQTWFFIISAAIFTLSSKPLIEFIQKTTNRLFFRDKYDPQSLINEIGRILASEIELASLSREITSTLQRNLHPIHVDIVVLDKERVYFESGAYFADRLDQFASDMQKLSEQLLVKDELPENEQKSLLRHHGINVFTPLNTHNEKVGYLLLSDKVNGTPYSPGDKKVIGIIADELAIAIQNSRAYSQIQDFNKTLQAKIEEATVQLRAANEKLKQADETKDDFISMASHQLSTPLAAIDGYLSLATKGIYGHMNEKLDKSIKSALNRTQVMKHLLIDLLDISRMSANRFYMEIRPVDLNQVVSEEMSALAHDAEDAKVELNYHPPDTNVPVINLDEQKTRQAVMNLITNAISYASGGKVDVYLDSDDTNITYKVVDNGIGVPDSQKPRLFNKFYRADNAKKHRPSGTGIGLYLVKRVIEDQHGQIIFESTEGKGSTFGFSFPTHSVLEPGQHFMETKEEAAI